MAIRTVVAMKQQDTDMAKEFSQFNKAGRKYAQMGKSQEKSERREPRRDKQVARGVGFAQKAQSQVDSARHAMGRGRVGKQYGKGEA